MDWNEIRAIMKLFIKERLRESGAKGIVLGLSGGLDSAVTLKICVEALGTERVYALLMPEKKDDDRDFEDALRYAEELGIDYTVIEIAPIVKMLSSAVELSRESLANVKARTRMLLLYAYANERNLLVAGTSNKSELLTGYFTKYGDGGVDFMPLGDLYKTEVMEFARFLEVPEVFIKKSPSANLYPGQSDEEDIGMKYDSLDCILREIERDETDERISENCGLSVKEVKRIRDMVRKSAHKRRMPLIPKIGLRTVGWDWRE